MHTGRLIINAFIKQNENGEDVCTLCIANNIDKDILQRYKNKTNHNVTGFLQHMEEWRG